MDPDNENKQEQSVAIPEQSQDIETCDGPSQGTQDNDNLAKVPDTTLIEEAETAVTLNKSENGLGDNLKDQSNSDILPPNNDSCSASEPKSPSSIEEPTLNSESSSQSPESEGSKFREIDLDQDNVKETEGKYESDSPQNEEAVNERGDGCDGNQPEMITTKDSVTHVEHDVAVGKEHDVAEEKVHDDTEEIINDATEENVNDDREQKIKDDTEENVNDDTKENVNDDTEENVNDDLEEKVKDDAEEKIKDDTEKNVNNVEEKVKDDMEEQVNDDMEEQINDDMEGKENDDIEDKKNDHLEEKENDHMDGKVNDDLEGGENDDMEGKENDDMEGNENDDMEGNENDDMEGKGNDGTEDNVPDSSHDKDISDTAIATTPGNDKSILMSSVIDTSIFPGPPVDRDNLVRANCFELDSLDETAGLSVPQEDLLTVPNTAVSHSDSSQPGPSDDREDISDEELDLESSNNNIVFDDTAQTNLTGASNLNPEAVKKSDNLSVNSSDAGDIIDLNLEDAAMKSIDGICDTEDHRQSKVSSGDLEAVSDDELPSVPQAIEVVPPEHRKSLLEDREEVSSSEDEDLGRPQNSDDMLPISSGDELPNSSRNEIRERKSENLAEKSQDAESLARLESLEAEPISDEEDNTMTNDTPKQMSFDDGEAGEIKSPVLGSPISEQGDLMLGEVEPVSADESPDTDGELPSGDEMDKTSDKQADKKFESIDSDDDIAEDIQKPGGLAPRRANESSSRISMSDGGKGDATRDRAEYMETISDEENLDGGDSVKRDRKRLDNMAVSHKESPLLEKGHLQTSFNEHQVELDYEEGYGEDGDAKTESRDDEGKPDTKLTSGKDGEQGDEGEVLASDKDEGELSDDDCEEGEIKEPGSKKLFVKPICRFFQRGHCTWGINCRFLHPGVNDKGNYQMIEVPGFKPVGIRARLGVPGQFPEQQQQQEEEAELPPPPMPDVPRVETAWERGLRIAKEQRKKASERKEKEPDFEEKRLNLSVDEERELNKENERTPRIIPKDPYYDQQAFEVDEYYKIPREPWHTGHYDNFEVRYQHQQGNSYSPPYREKPPAPPMRYSRPLSPPIDKFGRHREDRPPPMPPMPPERHEPLRVSDYPPPAPNKHPDEWVDPWQRAKSPKQRKARSRSRGRRTHRSLSDSSDSSRSNSRSSSGSSRSSRSDSSSGSSSRSRSPEPAPPGVDRNDRQDRFGNDQPRSMVSVRGGHPDGRGYNRYDNNNTRYQRDGGQNYYNSRNTYKPRQDSNFYHGGRGGPGGNYYGNNNNNANNYHGGYSGRGGFGGQGGGYGGRDQRGRGGRYGRMSPSRGGRGPTPDRPLPYTRPRPKSRSSSRSSSSRSRSHSRSKSSDSSRSRSSSNSSRTSSSSSSSGGSADSDHLYRDLGSPSKAPRHMAQKKRSGLDNRKDNRGNPKSNQSRHPSSPAVDRMPHPRSPPAPHSRGDLKYSQIPLPPSGRGDSNTKYASRNAPQPPIKAKDPLKVVGQKPNIKLTLLSKQQQQSNLGDRPNPLASPPHKRRMSDRDSPPPAAPPTKRLNLSMQASSLRAAADRASKIRQEKAKSPPLGSLPPPPSSSSSNVQRSKNPPPPTSPQRQPTSKARPSTQSAGAKPAVKVPSGGSASSNPSGSKAKKSMSSRREELLKQLKAVEDAIARKKFKMS